MIKENLIQIKLMNKEKDMRDNCNNLEVNMELSNKSSNLIRKVRKQNLLFRNKKKNHNNFNSQHKKYKINSYNNKINRKKNPMKIYNDNSLESVSKIKIFNYYYHYKINK